MSRRTLALGAAVVLAAAIGLVVMLRAPAEDAPSRPAEASRPAEPEPGQPRVTRTPSGAATPTPRSGSGATDYTVGGVRIRDHRAGTHAPADVPPAVHTLGGHKVSSQLVSGFAQKLRGVVAECATSVDAGARGAKARAEGEIRIAIKGGQATISRAIFQLRDVTGASDPAKLCMEEKAVTISIPSGDEPDVEDYSVTLSLSLL
jgi:hypothetical protein